MPFPQPDPAASISRAASVPCLDARSSAAEVPEGRLSDEFMKRLAEFGLAESNVLLYVGPDMGPGRGWLDPFPVGYSCAFVDRGQPSIDRQVPIPTSCDSLSITAHDPEKVQPANWL